MSNNYNKTKIVHKLERAPSLPAITTDKTPKSDKISDRRATYTPRYQVTPFE